MIMYYRQHDWRERRVSKGLKYKRTIITTTHAGKATAIGFIVSRYPPAYSLLKVNYIIHIGLIENN